MLRTETEKERHLSETVTVYGQSEYIGIHALASAVNSLAAAGVSCQAAQVRIAYPVRVGKPAVYRIKKNMEKWLKESHVEAEEILLTPNPSLGLSVVTVSAAGWMEKEEIVQLKAWETARDIVMLKWAGMEGMLRILEEKKPELQARFSPAFLRQIHNRRKELFAGDALDEVRKSGGYPFAQMGEGGVFSALWELSRKSGRGLDLELKKIPVLQETVEVCEYFGLNPYQLASAGSFLILTEEGETLADKLCEKGMVASKIGCLTDKRDKIIRNGDDIRYLDRPAPDEIYKIYVRD